LRADRFFSGASSAVVSSGASVAVADSGVESSEPVLSVTWLA
jgi:hypothetical protein